MAGLLSLAQYAEETEENEEENGGVLFTSFVVVEIIIILLFQRLLPNDAPTNEYILCRCAHPRYLYINYIFCMQCIHRICKLKANSLSWVRGCHGRCIGVSRLLYLPLV
jgi:hypothetical protein